MLQPIDIAVAFVAAHRFHHRGSWSPAEVRADLGLPWSSIHLSLQRLSEASVVVRGRVRRQALATLLPALQYLVPATVSGVVERCRGVPTGPTSPALQGQNVRVVGEPMVWPDEDGEVEGIPVPPLYKTIPRVAQEREDLHALFSAIDSARTGRARELRLAHDALIEFVGLPRRAA
jgi:hypothetical protein